MIRQNSVGTKTSELYGGAQWYFSVAVHNADLAQIDNHTKNYAAN